MNALELLDQIEAREIKLASRLLSQRSRVELLVLFAHYGHSDSCFRPDNYSYSDLVHLLSSDVVANGDLSRLADRKA